MTHTLTVTGMTCNSCANKVTDAIAGVAGVTDLDVDVASGEVSFAGDVDPARVRAAIEQAGYRVAS